VSVVLVAIAIAAAACGGSSGPTVNTRTAPADIARVYDSLFNLSNKSVSVKLAAIQNGSSLRTAMTVVLATPLAAEASGAKVTHVKVLSDSQCQQAGVSSPCASVTYNVLKKNGTTLLPNARGYAVFVNGKWLVAKPTVCALFSEAYSLVGKGTPPGCA
jgi:hypothetical protein